MLCINGTWTKIIETDVCMSNLLNYGNDFTKKIIDKLSNSFWVDVLKAHSSILETTQINYLEEFLQTPIFYNENIKIGGFSIKKKWNDKGVYFINDTVSKNGEFLTELEFKKNVQNKYKLPGNNPSYKKICKKYKNYLRKYQITKSITTNVLKYLP